MTQSNPDMVRARDALATEPLAITEAALLDEVRERLNDQAGSGAHDSRRHLSITIPLAATDLLAWLYSRKGNARFYWRSRNGELEVAAVGIAHQLLLGSRSELTAALNTFDDAIRNGETSTVPLVYVVAPFNLERNSSSLHEVRTRIVTPELLLARVGENYSLTLNLNNVQEAPRRRLEELAGVLGIPVPVIPELATTKSMIRSDLPDRREWQRNIEAVLAATRSGEVGKIVLARRTDLELEQAIDPFALLRQLQQYNQKACAFLFQVDEECTFLGVSPERLFKISGRQLTTEAIAGTAPRGATPEEDQRLAEDLLHSEKNIEEQRFVIEAVRNAVEKFCIDTEDLPATPSLLKLPKVQHLMTRFSGKLADTSKLGDLFSHMFPTPAVCGSPRDRALELISKLDGFDRQYYAGAVGVVGKGRAEFTVAIRSLSLSPNKISLYAGAGIVPGSDAELEWAELNQKLATILTVLEGAG